VDLILCHVDVSSDDLQLRPIRTGKHNRSYWVDIQSETRYVLRVAPPDDAGFLFYEKLMMHQEPGLHKLIRKHTEIPVAEVVGYDFGRTQINRDYMLMTALPGTPLSEISQLYDGARRRTLHQVGHYLRELHNLTATAHIGRRKYGYLGEHHPMSPAPTWVEAFEQMWNALLDDVVACGSYNQQEAQFMRELFQAHRPAFDRAVEPRLLHMDIWAQNILVDAEGNVTGLVDFDRALWGDVEIEFAVLDYCGISEPAFWQGYGSTRDTSKAAMIRRQFYLLYEIQKYMPIRVWRRNNPLGAQRYKRQSLQMAKALM
jgi:aminoglycoside phosphotransferase (APT) family kinase protein